MSDPRALADAALAVARERAALQREIREALVAGDEGRALELTRRLVGLEEPVDEPHVHH